MSTHLFTHFYPFSTRPSVVLAPPLTSLPRGHWRAANSRSLALLLSVRLGFSTRAVLGGESPHPLVPGRDVFPSIERAFRRVSFLSSVRARAGAALSRTLCHSPVSCAWDFADGRLQLYNNRVSFSPRPSYIVAFASLITKHPVNPLDRLLTPVVILLQIHPTLFTLTGKAPQTCLVLLSLPHML
ncbi:hypothetical protein BV20DRAFT_406488 [Pilatotrama ljubarskyi]|nr:hypothetical protein BV20DRAFT_406488 [Pilatotrama ljubarskyi]